MVIDHTAALSARVTAYAVGVTCYRFPVKFGGGDGDGVSGWGGGGG